MITKKNVNCPHCSFEHEVEVDNSTYIGDGRAPNGYPMWSSPVKCRCGRAFEYNMDRIDRKTRPVLM